MMKLAILGCFVAAVSGVSRSKDAKTLMENMNHPDSMLQASKTNRNAASNESLLSAQTELVACPNGQSPCLDQKKFDVAQKKHDDECSARKKEAEKKVLCAAFEGDGGSTTCCSNSSHKCNNANGKCEPFAIALNAESKTKPNFNWSVLNSKPNE